jgi:hypothetical protein
MPCQIGLSGPNQIGLLLGLWLWGPKQVGLLLGLGTWGPKQIGLPLGLGLWGSKQIGLLLGLGLWGPKQIGLLLGLELPAPRPDRTPKSARVKTNSYLDSDSVRFPASFLLHLGCLHEGTGAYMSILVPPEPLSCHVHTGPFDPAMKRQYDRHLALP